MRWRYLACLSLGLGLPLISWGQSNVQHFDPVSPIIFWVTCIYCLSIVGQFLAKKFAQPAVLGELFMGILFANVCYYFKVPEVIMLREGAEIFRIFPDILAGKDMLTAVSQHLHNAVDVDIILHALSSPKGDELFKTTYVLDVFSRYGLIYLLFMVGLETSWKELTETGKPSLMVATLGVLAPMILGFLSLYLFFPHYSFQTNVFVAATLTATSVGITARVLKDLKKIRTKEARIILGAAMIDDILGLLVLAVVRAGVSGVLFKRTGFR
ncbi:MAG: cation:proton antiporter [Gammaproteobacteria bacterium]|nr:cation:proton antiporter [Gammaproteobacteria bacterium]